MSRVFHEARELGVRHGAGIDPERRDAHAAHRALAVSWVGKAVRPAIVNSPLSSSIIEANLAVVVAYGVALSRPRSVVSSPEKAMATVCSTRPSPNLSPS